jgi:hypothetical protein
MYAFGTRVARREHVMRREGRRRSEARTAEVETIVIRIRRSLCG